MEESQTASTEKAREKPESSEIITKNPPEHVRRAQQNKSPYEMNLSMII